MEAKRWEMVYLELKYCERCGGLWFRRKGESQAYCESCLLQMSEMAGPENEANVSYARLRRGLASDHRMVNILALWPREGKA